MTKWADLQRLHDVNKGRHILDLFDEKRAADFSVADQGMLFDYSKTNIDAATRAALVKLAVRSSRTRGCNTRSTASLAAPWWASRPGMATRSCGWCQKR